MATNESSLTPGSVFAILLSLALVGGATIYYIKKKEERWRQPHEHGHHRREPHALPPATPAPSHVLPHVAPEHHGPPPPAPHQYTQPQISADDTQRALAQVAAMLRAPWQRNVDDITVLQTAVQNPSLPADKRAMAQEILSAAHVEIARRAPRRQPRHPDYAPPQQDVSRAQPWQDFAHAAPPHVETPHGVTPLPIPDWARDVSQPHAQPPVTYTPYPMPPLEHPHVAQPSAHDLSRPPMPGPGQSWVEAAKAIGLIKPGDPLMGVQEAQHYINMLTTGTVKLVEDGILGDKTHEALSAFQLAHHLPITGNLDAETSAALLYAGLAQH